MHVKAYATIADLATQFYVAPELILQEAVSKLVPLMVALDEATPLCLKNHSGQRFAYNQMRRPDFLELDRNTVGALLIYGKCRLRESSLGVKLQGENQFIASLPSASMDFALESEAQDLSETTKQIGRAWTPASPYLWAIGSVVLEGQEAFIDIDFSRVVVPQTYLLEKRRKIRSQAKVDSQGYLSNKLKLLIEASQVFWANADLGEKDTYPDRKIIERWFLDQGLSSSLANAACTIITPENADVKGRPGNGEFFHNVIPAPGSIT